MNAKERLDMIRERLVGTVARTVKPVGLFAASHPEQKARIRKAVTLPVYPRPSACRVMVCDAGHAVGRDIQWVKEADIEPVKPLRHKRGYKKHALTCIAEQLPAKLPKLFAQ